MEPTRSAPELASKVTDNAAWRAERPGQLTVPRTELVATIAKILDAIKAEAVYCTEKDGHRGALLIVNVESPSQIPARAEPPWLPARITPFPSGRKGLPPGRSPST